MKKIVCIILSLTMMLSTLSVRAAAPDPDLGALIDVGKEANALLQNTSDQMKALTDGMSRLCKDLDSLKIAQQVSLFTEFMSGLKTLSLGLSLVNGSVSFLKLIGVLQDPLSAKLDTILDVLQDVQETVHSIDKRTEDIQKSLLVHASTTTYNFRLNRYDSFQQAWNNFFSSNGTYSELTRLMDAYQSEVGQRMIRCTEAWQSGSGIDVRALFSEDGIALVSGGNLGGSSLPFEPMFSDDNIEVAYSATLPASYITVERKLVNAESYLTLLNNAMTEGTKKALLDKAIVFTDDTIYSQYDAMDDAGKTAFAENLSKSFVDAVAYEAAYETANMTYGVGTFASAVSSAFTAFSDTVLGTNGVTSPLVSGLSKLSMTHAFEAEIKDEAAAICAYVSEMGLVFGEFTSFLVTLDKGFTAQNKERVAKRTMDTAYYPICYHDSFITGYDNYCYPLNSLVAYTEVSYRAAYDYDDGKMYDIHENAWELRNEDPNSTIDKAKEIIDNNRFLSKEDMTLLYLYYESAAAENPDLTQFSDYIRKTGIVPPEKYEVTTRDLFGRTVTKTKTFKPSPYFMLSAPTVNNLMKRKSAEYRTKDKVWGESLMMYDDLLHFKPGEWNYSRENELNTLYHDQLKADVFDTASAAGSLDSRLKNEMILSERALGYYALNKNLGVGEYIYAVFGDPNAYLTYGFDLHGDSSFTVHGRDYSILSYSTVPVRGSAYTSSVFAAGDWMMIGACTAILSGGIVAVALINKKKKKKKEEAV